MLRFFRQAALLSALCFFFASGCGEDIKRVPGAHAEIALRLLSPPYQDPFLGLSSLVFQFSTDELVVERAVDHSATEFVLDLTPADGVTLRLTGLDVDGQVVASGQSLPFDLVPDQVTEVSLFFARVGEFTQLGGQLTQPRFGHTATALGDGRVLIVGGATAGTLDAPADLAAAEIYDLHLQQTCDDVALACPGPAAASVRLGHTSTLASAGKVLIFGGRDGSGQLVDDILIYEEVINGFRTLSGYDPARVLPRTDHAAAALRVEDAGASGFRDNVIILGGAIASGDGTAVTDNGLLFDSTLETFVRTDLQLERGRRSFRATTFGPERRLLLVTGGRDDQGLVLPVELFNGVELNIVQTGGGDRRSDLETGRMFHAAVENEAGVLLVGGEDGLVSLDAPEQFLFNSGGGNGLVSLDVRAVPAGHETRSGAMVLPTPSGQVVLAGGIHSDGLDTTILSNAEMLVPDAENREAAYVAVPGLDGPLAHATVTRLFNGAFLIIGGLRAVDGQLPPSGAIWYYNPS